MATAIAKHKNAKDHYDILAKAAAKAEVGSGKKRGGEEEEEEGGGGGAARYVFSGPPPGYISTPSSQPPQPPLQLCQKVRRGRRLKAHHPAHRGAEQVLGEAAQQAFGAAHHQARRRELDNLYGDKSTPHLNNYFDSEDFTKIISLGLVQRPESLPPAAALTEGGDEVRVHHPTL